MSRNRSSSKGGGGGSGGACSRSSPRVEIAEVPEFHQQQQSAHPSNRMTQRQSRNQRRKNLALSCTVLCAVGAATTLFPDGLVDIGGPFTRLVSGRKLRASKQRRLQLAAADYSALLAANTAPPAVPAMGAPAMGAAPVAAGTTGAGGELSDADIAKFLAKYDLELKDLELLQKLREGYVRADGTSTSSTSTGAPPVPEPPARPAAPPVDYAAMLGTPATLPAAATRSVSAPEAAATPAAPAAPATTTTSSTSTPLAVPLGPIEDCSAEADNWLQNFCELKNYKNKFGDCNVPDKWDENRILSNWVKKQREQYDLLMAGQDNQMNSDRKDKLDEIGFDFTGTGADAAGGASVNTSTGAVAAAPPAAGTTSTMSGASQPAMPDVPPAAPATPAVPTDPTQMTFEQQMAAMQALSF